MSVLHSWFNGELFPAEQIVPRDKEYRAIANEIEEVKEHIIGRLSSEDSARFDHLQELMLLHSSMYAYAHFAYGFKLGVLLMQEVSMGNDGPTV